MPSVTAMWKRVEQAGLTVDVLLAALVLAVLTGGISSVLTERFVPEGPNFELWPYQYPFTGAGLLGAALLGSNVPRFTTPIAKVAIAAVVAYVGWSLLSVTWSVIPSITSERAVTSVGIACFAVWFGSRLAVVQQLLAVAAALAVFIAASALLVAFAPSYGRGTWDDASIGGFRGATTNPNSLGPLCVLSLITFATMAWRSRDTRVRVGWGVGFLAASVLLIGSRSDTSFVAAGAASAGAAAIYGARLLRERGASGTNVAWGAGLATAIVAIVCWRWFWSISNLLTGDPTFGNRRRMWDQMVRTAELRPWRGWGYWSFWNVTNSGALIRLGSAHNSAIEVYLGLGRIGVVFFIAIVGLALVGVVARLWESFDIPSTWLTIVVIALLISHVTESFVLWHSYNWTLISATAVGCWTRAPRRVAGAPNIDQASAAPR